MSCSIEFISSLQMRQLKLVSARLEVAATVTVALALLAMPKVVSSDGLLFSAFEKIFISLQAVRTECQTRNQFLSEIVFCSSASFPLEGQF
jgi:hypothetical protein